MVMTVSEWTELLDYILKNFKVIYDDFRKEVYEPYHKRGIVGFIRFDRKEIFFDQDIRGKTEEWTWAHEALSIYYYAILKIIIHDDEIEKEAKALCENAMMTGILKRYILLAKSGDANPPGS